MFELREFHLELAFAATGALRKNVEYQRRAVEYPELQFLLEIALLRRRQGGVKNDQPGICRFGKRLEFLDFAGANIEGRVRTSAAHERMACDREPGRLRQLRQLGRGVSVLATPELDADEEGAVGALAAVRLDLEDAQATDSAARLTGRAGTTVEMACL